ncbi:MAG: GAF domain-containing protein, partial [Gammaproteobacteria bacterium]|nr:GAF domain-containing protein [Gammaproteobacteria bacterium]
MKNHNGEIEALRERISQLSGAILRINSSLDINTVLREVVDSARTLTNARYGIITTLDEEGQILDFISSGFTEEEHQQFVQWPDGPRLFEHFRHLSGAVRLADLPAYVRSLGFSAELIRSKTFQGTPMRHRGVHVGNFFLAEKEGAQEFTGEDEEILVLFASQAGTAITNAWVYHDEQRARANLEALIETSPIGVVVFDARSGNPVSFNREARRIFEVLRTPGRSIEQLMEVMTYTRADGREVTLDEFVLVRELNTGETMRSEEVMFSVADGRSVKALINATPIFSADNVVESVVVTMQDLAPLEELDRMRAEFTSMVSHELRVPLASIKGSASTVLNAQQPLDLTEIHQFFHIIDEQSDHMRSLISDLLDAGRIDMGTLSVNPNSLELADLVDQARNTFLSGGSGHPILIDLPPDLPRVMGDSMRIAQVLVNLFSNASAHSPESSPIRVTAVRDDVHVAVSVFDEGWGMSPKELENLFQKYSHLGGDRAPG